MGFWDSLVQNVGGAIAGVTGGIRSDSVGSGTFPSGGPFGISSSYGADGPNAYAAYYPPYETLTPQYPYPSPYTLATEGYRKNSIVYACINKRANMYADAQLKVYKDREKNTAVVLDDHKLRSLIKKPNPAMTEYDFHRAKEIYTCIAGFASFEIEFSNGGEPIALWPMRPDWCSFRRGIGKPIGSVRYQPYGLPPVDIPIERILYFEELDPIYPLLKGLSRTAVALKEIGVDNSVSAFFDTFFRKGAQTAGGVLTSDQNIDKAEATRAQELWQEQHGGVENWSKVTVIGKGLTYQDTGMKIKEMDFSVIDGRTEVRVCQVFDVDPIVISSKIGMGTITENNKKEAMRGMYQSVISPLWRNSALKITDKLMPFYDEPDDIEAYFDTSEVVGMQEDRNERFDRADKGFVDNMLYRNAALKEAGFDPVDFDESGQEIKVWAFQLPKVAVRAMPSGGEIDTAIQDQLEGISPDVTDAAGNPIKSSLLATHNPPFDAALETAKRAERKQYRAFVARRVKEGKAADIGAFKFRYLTRADQAALKSGQSEPNDIVAELARVRVAIEAATAELQAEKS